MIPRPIGRSPLVPRLVLVRQAQRYLDDLCTALDALGLAPLERSGTVADLAHALAQEVARIERELDKDLGRAPPSASSGASA